MKIACAMAITATLLAASPALAYTTQNESDGGACSTDGSACDVFCDNGQRAGTMYWNGSVWTDGVKWDEDFDTEASAICAANGSDCT